jgi:hypothetical protein
MRRLNRLRAAWHLADTYPSLLVKSLPLGVELPGRSRPEIEHLDIVSQSGQRNGNKRRSRPEAVAHIAQQLLGDERDPQ